MTFSELANWLRRNSLAIGASILILSLLASILFLPWKKSAPIANDTTPGAHPTVVQADTVPARLFTVVPRDIQIKDYFQYIKGLQAAYDSLLPYDLSEHLLVRANPWIIDTLESTDYYRRKWKNDTLYAQPQAVALHRGDTLYFPDSVQAANLIDRMNHTLIDVNIPEYRLRILEYGDTLYSFPVRVGKNKVRYLESAGHQVDLRTRTGTGSVIRINRFPVFTDPVTGKKFTHTKRDDKVVTLMPQIPWVEVELDGNRYGQMIHPTTNPNTLNRAYSNGCVGLAEADAWRFYYHAPLGTSVVFRYDLEIIGAAGDTLLLPDIYHWAKKAKKHAVTFRVLP